MHTVAVIQARMSSTRLPGKVMMPLAGTPVIEHVVRRVSAASTVDEMVVATTTHNPDDVIVRAAQQRGATVFGGSETDVLRRMHKAATEHDADQIVRICADSLLVSGSIIDAAVERLGEGSYDYISNKVERVFPIGFDVEAFTKSSFDTVEERSTEPHEREHVTVYYQEHPEEFECGDIPSSDVFSDAALQERTDIRLTLDEPADYFLLNNVYQHMAEESPSPAAAIRYIDRYGLAEVNAGVRQKSMYESEESTGNERT